MEAKGKRYLWVVEKRILGPARPSLMNCRGRLISLERPLVMGILNVTPDSFSDGGRFEQVEVAVEHVARMIREGADIIDIGGASSRPGAALVTAEEEWARIQPHLARIRKEFPETLISIDTFHDTVASRAIHEGADIINDISGGSFSEEMLPLVGKAGLPYILMHMQGNPQSMQINPTYEDVVAEVYAFFVERIKQARASGMKDIIIDLGFGFGKTLEHNYALLRNLDKFKALGLPILVGVSRKSMIYRPLHADPSDVLAATSALHMRALDLGANILRVHDVAAAVQTVKMHELLRNGAV